MIGQNLEHHYTQTNTNNTGRHKPSYKEQGVKTSLLSNDSMVSKNNSFYIILHTVMC